LNFEGILLELFLNSICSQHTALYVIIRLSILAAYFRIFSSCFLKFLAISLDFQLKKHEEILTVHEHECTEECGFCDMDGDEQGIFFPGFSWKSIYVPNFL
jgi:hypothetical protein